MYVCGVKYNGKLPSGIEVGYLDMKSIYCGVQAVFPYDPQNKKVYVDYVQGYGFKLLPTSRLIITGILGYYTENFFETVGLKNINYGGGLMLTYNVIAVGVSITNNEKMSLRVGITIK